MEVNYFTTLYWFCHTSTWIRHRYTCVSHPEPPSPIPPCTILLVRLSAPAPSIQYHALSLDWWFISYMILYMFQWHSPKSSHPDFYFIIFLLYNIVLVLLYINMNLPQVYTCSPSWISLPVPSLWAIPVHQPQASCIKPGLAIHFIYDIIHVSMPFSQVIPPSPSPTESKRLFYTSVSLLLSHIKGYCYHLSKFHIYALVYCIGVFLSGLLHSV